MELMDLHHSPSCSYCLHTVGASTYTHSLLCVLLPCFKWPKHEFVMEMLHIPRICPNIVHVDDLVPSSTERYVDTVCVKSIIPDILNSESLYVMAM